MLVHRWLAMLTHRWLIMLAHRWLITFVHRWPILDGSQLAHSISCIGSMLCLLQGLFQVVIGGLLGRFSHFNVTFVKIDILHKGSLFYLS